MVSTPTPPEDSASASAEAQPEPSAPSLQSAQAAREAGRLADAVHAARLRLRDCDDTERPVLRLLVAQCLCDLGLDAEAIHAARLAFDAAHAVRDYGQLVRSLSVLGSVHARMGDHEASQRLLLEALTRARETGDRAIVRVTLHNSINAMTTQLAERRVFGQPLPSGPTMISTMARQLLAGVAEETMPFRRLSMTMTAAVGLGVEGQFETCLAQLRSVVAESESIGMDMLVLNAMTNLGLVMLLQGNAQASRMQYELTLARFGSEIQQTRLLATIHEGLAHACAALDDTVAAQENEQQWQALNRQLDEHLARERQSIVADSLAVVDHLDRLDARWQQPA